MKTIFTLFVLLAAICFRSIAQSAKTADSLNDALVKTGQDTSRVKVLLKMADLYFFTMPDKARQFAEEALALSGKLDYSRGRVRSLNQLGEALRFLGNFPQALKVNFDALQLNRQMEDRSGEATTLGFIGFTYIEFREYRLGLDYLMEAVKLNRQLGNQLKETFDLTNIANAYNLMNRPDSGLYYSQWAYKTYSGLQHGPLKSLVLGRMGDAYAGLGKKDSAIAYYQTGLATSFKANETVNRIKIQRRLANVFETSGEYDSSLYYARQSFINGQRSAQLLEMLGASELLGRLFRKTKNTDSAFYYMDIAKGFADSLYGEKKLKELQLLVLEEQKREQQQQQEQEQYRTRTKMIALWSATGFFLVIVFILYISNRRQQKANALLQKTLLHLRSAQAQLVQSEKMASLGELTAGIAHEIQNPLNFVNNFSEVNKELLAELKEEARKGNVNEVKAIANDLIDNSEKINHHGRRADAIVKGMLQHSRISSGQKELTDINALADEYLRLAYHGLKAKDKTFNANFRTDFDESLPKISIIPQDIGRVLLNIINNAFYAVNEKAKTADENYEPLVTIASQNPSPRERGGDKVLLTISDNGKGIPKNIIDKIFQPFFTTKPTGQGTGLGLSLAYEVVKAHGGELNVKTEEGEKTEFIVSLPIVNE